MPHLVVFFCPLAAFLLYYNTLQAGFVYDDKRAILRNMDVAAARSTSLKDVMVHDFWGTPLNVSGSHGSYRPLVTLTFRWTAQLAGLDQAYWFHWTNVLLHCSVTAAVTILAGRVSLTDGDNAGRYVSGLLFAAHPVHCEAVAGLVGRADMACTMFFLIGLSTYANRVKQGRKSCSGLIVTLVLTCAAFLSKEYGIMLPLACFLYDMIAHLNKRTLRMDSDQFFKRRRNRSALSDWAVLTLWTLLLVFFRLWLSDFRTPHFASADNPVAASPSWTTRTLTFLYLPVFHFGLLLWPRWLSFDWSMDAIVPITTFRDFRNILTLLFYTSLILVVRWTIIKSYESKQWKNVALLLLIIIVPFLPATNLFAYVGFVVAERILYLSSVGFCLLVGTGVNILLVHQSKGPQKAVVISSISILLLSHGYRTIKRNSDWYNEESLYRSGTEINPPKAYGNLGVVLLESGRLTEAEWSFKRALFYRPNTADVHHNLGNLFQKQFRYEESLQAYNQAIHFRPHLAEAYSQKAKVLYKLERWAEAEKTLLDCTQITEYSQKDPVSHLTAKVSATILMADILARNASRDKEAEEWLRRARQLSPRNPYIYYQLGEFLASRSRQNEAADTFIQAAEIDPDNVAWTVAAAHALHDVSRNGEAEVYFRRAVNLGPTDISHWINLGAVLHVQGKFREAELVYQKALQLAPNHPLMTANLRRLRNSLLKGSHQNNNNQSQTKIS